MDEYWGDVVPFQKPPRRERRPGPYVVGLLTAVALFGIAAALAQILPRDTADDLYSLISSLVAGGILLILVVGVAAVSDRWPDKVLALVTAACFIIAALAYPTSRADQNLPVIFSLGVLYPLGRALGLACLLVLVFRVARRLFRGRSTVTPRDR